MIMIININKYIFLLKAVSMKNCKHPYYIRVTFLGSVIHYPFLTEQL